MSVTIRASVSGAADVAALPLVSRGPVDVSVEFEDSSEADTWTTGGLRDVVEQVAASASAAFLQAVSGR